MFESYSTLLPVVAGFILLGVAALAGWAMYFAQKVNIRDNIPYGHTILQAAKKNLPVLILNHPSSNVANAYLGTYDKQGSITFDIEDLGLHINPENSGRTKPIRLGGVDFYLGSHISPEMLSQDDIIKLNKLSDVREKYPELRGLTNQTLHALITQPMEDWRENCKSVLTYFQDQIKSPVVTLSDELPDDVEGLIETLAKVKKDWDNMPTHADYLVTTYESIKFKDVTPEPKKAGLFDGLKKKMKKADADAEEENEDKAITRKYVYKNAQRIPSGIRLMSLFDAQNTDSAALTCAALEQYGLECEAKYRMEMKDQLRAGFEKYLPICFSVGIMILLAGIGIYIMSQVFS